MQDKVTVIVPCYNVEKYIERCLTSLVKQTHTNLEVIMVEDCSTDSTKNIVSRFEKKYKNFRAIYNRINGGLGHARNIGIGEATSPYISFLDSDDWVPDNFIQEMLLAIQKHDADLSVCDVFMRYDDSGKDVRVRAYNIAPNKIGLLDTGLAASSSPKLFKTKLFDNLRYPEDIINEDIPVVLAILCNYKAVYTDKTYFNYYQRSGSIQNGLVTKKRLDAFKSVGLLRKNIVGELKDKEFEVIVWHQLFSLLIFVIPRVKGLLSRRNMIADFYENAMKWNIEINYNNIGFLNFVKYNNAYRLYGKILVFFYQKKLFMATSSLMWSYSFAIQVKYIIKKMKLFVKKIIHASLHPYLIVKKLSRLIVGRSVIKKNITLSNLKTLASRQSRIIDKHRVSVVVPNYNYERFLLQRIFSILNQNGKIGEIIILDDNSTDDSITLAKKIKDSIKDFVPVHIITNDSNRGVFKQWERGFRLARFDLIWIAEADDYSDPMYLSRVSSPMIDDPGIVLSYCNTGYINRDGILLGDVKNDIDYLNSGHWNGDYIIPGKQEFMEYTYLNNTIANVSSVIFRKIENVNVSDLFLDIKEFRQAGDWLFYVNYMMHGKISYVDKLLNYYRVHGGNVSSTTRAKDHLDEINRVYNIFSKIVKLTEPQKQKMRHRIKYLTKQWGV